MLCNIPKEHRYHLHCAEVLNDANNLYHKISQPTTLGVTSED
jgi:hypothetical protein